MKTVGEIVRTWREAQGWNSRELAERAGTDRQSIENLEARPEIKLIPIWLPRLSRLMGYATVEELLAFKDPPAPATEGPLFLGDDFVPPETEAQLLSQMRFRISSKPMSWGDLRMKKELDDLFEVVLEDDAMAPDFPAGTIIKFRRAGETEAKFGDRVLLRDRTGEFHFREFTQNFDGDPWEGAATGRGFRNILPRQHGATVVAIKAGHYVEGS